MGASAGESCRRLRGDDQFQDQRKDQRKDQRSEARGFCQTCCQLHHADPYRSPAAEEMSVKYF